MKGLIMTHKFDYENFLKDKTVALVASGSSLKDSNRGEEIDSYDIVVRLNRALPLKNEKDVGKRTDILYNTLDGRSKAGGPIDGRLWKSCGVKYVRCPYPTTESFVVPRKSHVLEPHLPFDYISDEIYRPVREKCNGYRPNSGTVSLVDILSFDIKKVHLFGLDFFRTLYDTGYLSHGKNVKAFEAHLASNRKDRHDPDSQYLFFKNDIYPNDERIIVDEYFQDILNDSNYDRMYFVENN
tara:strand:+ start:352 stop:1071 length:720 start_codon:yes stop_codon:yes gene_type:complete